ncbi:MAG: 4-hydroxy-tetrahydrodipicolinate synthase [Prolixibacteraceae bacterium]|jgi:4-hydroxy-tetrahydrodipicolinate synthase|nr:4-hydroxy-tetrahydrodipicolinate synthase [Prolixibacteraceae bacterium]
MNNIFKGTGPAVITPFKNDDLLVDYDALGRILDFQIGNGIDFVVALGTTAETVTLTHDERHKVYQFIKQRINKRIPLMVGFGSNNTEEVLDHIKSADFDGIDAILSVVPYYSKPSQEGIFRHFMAIAEASPVPIMLYNVPSRCGANMTATTTLRLANASDKFIGIKEASGDIEQIKEIIENAPEGFGVLSGDDAMIEEVTSIGGEGVISVMANAFPAEIVKLTNLARNKSEGALALQKSYIEIIDLLFVDGNPAGVKAVLSQKGMIDNILRLPLCPVSDETFKKIATIL